MKINQTENRYNRLKVRLLRLAIVVFFIGLSVQIELFDLTLFGISQSLSTTFIVMMLTMLVPCFFVSELLAFVYKNRFVLMPVALFFIGGALSAFYSPFPLAYSSKWLIKYAFYFGTAFALVFLISLDPRSGIFFLKTLIVTSILMAVVAVIEANHGGVAGYLSDHFRSGESLIVGEKFRPAVTMEHPNILGCAIAVSALVLVYLKSNRIISGLPFFTAIIIFSAGIVYTSSRNAILTLAIPLIILISNRSVRITALTVLIINVTVIITLSPSFTRIVELVKVPQYIYRQLSQKAQETTTNIPETVSKSVSEQKYRSPQDRKASTVENKGYHPVGTRIMLYKSALRMFSDYPLLGIGPGGFNKAIRTYATEPLRTIEKYKIEREYLNANSGLMNLMAEFGLVGTVSVLAFLGILMIKTARAYGCYPLQPAEAVMLGGMIPFIPDAFFFNFFYMTVFLTLLLMFADPSLSYLSGLDKKRLQTETLSTMSDD